MQATFIRLSAGLILSFLACGLQAQTDEIESGFKKLDPVQEQRLRAVLAAPVPQGAPPASLRRHLREKEAAALALGDTAMEEAVRREAIRLLPDAAFKNNLAQTLQGKGQFDESNALMRQVIAETRNPIDKAFYLTNMACALVKQYKNAAARDALTEFAQESIVAQDKARDSASKLALLRASRNSAYCLSLLEQRLGRYAHAISAAEAGERYARQALALEIPNQSALGKSLVRNEVAQSVARSLQAYRAAGRLQDAERSLSEYMRFSTEVSLPKSYLSGIYFTAAQLRFSQREFSQSEALMRKSDQVLQEMGLGPLDSARLKRAVNVVISLAGQKKWHAALHEIEQLDRLAGDDASTKRKIRFAYERGLVYFGNQRYADAARLFEGIASGNSKVYPQNHFFVAQALGLQGASLWRTGIAADKVRALALLKAAVRDYMLPSNADFLENIGIRKESREFVFAAYLEAMAATPGEDATQAMGAADWVRNSIVQEALNDAAVRAAVQTPALADVVRREQDAKNEIAGLRRYLAGETGEVNSILPEIAARMRERMAVLDQERSRLQLEIKERFPDFERLVRPVAPTVQDIARQLAPEQALVMLLPTEDAVYAWAVASDRPAVFVRSTMTQARVNDLVARLRRYLDWGAGADAGRAYDNAAAFELYDRLLRPLQAAWKGKSQLLIAAGGALGQVPFAALHTEPYLGSDGRAPWLIREAAIAQVPSLSSWRAIKSIGMGQAASKAFFGWGDPVFSAQAVGATGSQPRRTRNIAVKRAQVLQDLMAPEPAAPISSALKYSDIPALPDTREELLAIAAVLRADPQHDVVLGANATRQSVLHASQTGELASRRVVAFATHGLMAGDLPNLMQPALALAVNGAEPQDPLAPLLTLDDVLTLKLNAEWVVLSACNTAAADGRADESLSGLARGFFYAGARSMLVTHWSVESESAKLLTTSVFDHYVSHPGSPKAESLRQAMLKVMSVPRYAHPAFWAPYALVGDSGR